MVQPVYGLEGLISSKLHQRDVLACYMQRASGCSRAFSLILLSQLLMIL